MMYNWQQKNWSNFEYDNAKFESIAFEFANLVGQSEGYVHGLPEDVQRESIINLLVKEALKTSEIEGELLNREDLISSIKRQLGYQYPINKVRDKRSEGIAELLVETRNTFAENLSEQTLFDWHKLLMKGSLGIEVGVWRTHAEPMQIISGAMGKEKVHFEAPPSTALPKEMAQFIDWFNKTNPNGSEPILNALTRAGIAHLYFESIHPFEDGNGRIGRILAEKALSQGLKKPILMSLSAMIESNKKEYYKTLNEASNLNKVNEWLEFFSKIAVKAQQNFISTIQFSINKTKFFDKIKDTVNERQMKVLGKMLEGSKESDFEGNMNARKYQAIAKTSKATATRDLQELVEKNIFSVKNAGRSTSYWVVI